MVDWSIEPGSISSLADAYRKAQQQGQREQVMRGLSQGSGPIDYNAAARAMAATGDSEGMFSLAKLAQQQYLTSPEYITKKATAEAEVAEKFAPKTANIKLADGTEVTAQKGPNGYEIPKIQGMPAPDPNAPQPPPGVDVKKWREQRATQLGNIDDKAVLEADKAVEAGTNAVQSLTRSIDLSKKALFGPGAGKIGYGLSLFGHQGGVATEELSNTVTNQALENLRATFGGNPTEGERKILLDVQGSVSQSPEVREKIYQNAIEAAQRRIEFSKRTAEQMRSGKYLLPEGQRNPQQQAPQPPQAENNAWRTKETILAARANPQQAIADAKAAVAKGMPPQEAMRRLQQSGIPVDPSVFGGGAPAVGPSGREIY